MTCMRYSPLINPPKRTVSKKYFHYLAKKFRKEIFKKAHLFKFCNKAI